MRPSLYTFSKILLTKPPEEKVFVSLSKRGYFYIPSNTDKKYELEDKIVEFLYDPQKRVFGFRVLTEYMPKENWSPSMRMLRRQGKTEKNAGMIMSMIGRILTGIGVDLAKMTNNTLKLELKEYEDMFTKSRILFVEIPRELTV